ncbi:MAG: DNA polymerase Y family protein [Polyangiaceae bacterium]|nr:DNA polymerase Y family protein [Polyangiaceae bacterium]
MERRVAAIVLPDLACELVRQRTEVTGPLGVIIEDLGEGEPALATAELDAVDEEARRLGVRCGQRVVEAAALAAHLSVHRVSQAEIEAALGRVAEIALVFGPTAALRLSGGEGNQRAAGGVGEEPFDTVWLDVTGTAHLVGGEEALIKEFIDRVGKLGHRARAAIAAGPRIAQALARWGTNGGSRAGEKSPLMPLPVQALPIDADVAKFLVQIGINTIENLSNLPSAAVAARLGPYASDVMSLMRGIDDVPLFPYEPPLVLAEEISFEEGVFSTEPLLFVLRGMTSRLSVRLASRGEACSRLDVAIPYDRSIARLRSKNRGEDADESSFCLRLTIDLPAPLSEEGDLMRALKAKLERAELRAPAVGIRLELSQIVGARRVQLDLSRDVAIDPDRLPALLAELSAEIGAERVGVLEVLDSHRPEARSRLMPADLQAPPALLAPEALSEGPSEPTRLLPEPLPIGRVELGRTVTIDGQAYVIERLRFEMRLQSVEWWTETPASRDYARAWLVAVKSPQGAPRSVAAEAWIFVDRTTGEGYLQGWSE